MLRNDLAALRRYFYIFHCVGTSQKPGILRTTFLPWKSFDFYKLWSLQKRNDFQTPSYSIFSCSTKANFWQFSQKTQIHFFEYETCYVGISKYISSFLVFLTPRVLLVQVRILEDLELMRRQSLLLHF